MKQAHMLNKIFKTPFKEKSKSLFCQEQFVVFEASMQGLHCAQHLILAAICIIKNQQTLS